MAKYIIKTDKAFSRTKEDRKPCYFYGYCGKLSQTPLGVDDIRYAKKFCDLGDACMHLHHIQHQKHKAFGRVFHIVRVSKDKNGVWRERESIDLNAPKYII